MLLLWAAACQKTSREPAAATVDSTSPMATSRFDKTAPTPAQPSATSCSEQLLLVQTENDDLFVLPTPTEACAAPEYSPSDTDLSLLSDSLLTSANAKTRTQAHNANTNKMQQGRCCRVRVRIRAVAKPPRVTVRGTSVTATDGRLAVEEIGANGDLSVTVRDVPSGSGGDGECRSMSGLASIPTGYHPLSVKWQPGNPSGDLVCYGKTEGRSLRFVPWLGFPMPAGYHIQYQYPNPSTSFNGCLQWSIFNGQYACIDMYPLYELVKG